jgi:hypothetical protein
MGDAAVRLEGQFCTWWMGGINECEVIDVLGRQRKGWVLTSGLGRGRERAVL